MNLFEQIEQWKSKRTLVELDIINVRHQRQTLHGRIFSFDSATSMILFYNEDRKSVENIHLSQIENASGSLIGDQATDNKPVQPAPKARPTIRSLVLQQINQLSDADLEALLPLLKHLTGAKRTSKPNTR